MEKQKLFLHVAHRDQARQLVVFLTRDYYLKKVAEQQLEAEKKEDPLEREYTYPTTTEADVEIKQLQQRILELNNSIESTFEKLQNLETEFDKVLNDMDKDE